MEAQRSLLKNNSYYEWFSSNACFTGSSSQTLQMFGGLQDWFVDSENIYPGSVSQVFKGRQYYRSMRLHKEGFYVLVQRRVEDITNEFKLIHTNLLSNLSELRQGPFSEAMEHVTNMKEYKQLITALLSTTVARSKDASNMLAIVFAVRTGNITQHFQAERQMLKACFYI